MLTPLVTKHKNKIKPSNVKSKQACGQIVLNPLLVTQSLVCRRAAVNHHQFKAAGKHTLLCRHSILEFAVHLFLFLCSPAKYLKILVRSGGNQGFKSKSLVDKSLFLPHLLTTGG